jgi:hypothetical protein
MLSPLNAYPSQASAREDADLFVGFNRNRRRHVTISEHFSRPGTEEKRL